MASYDGMSYAEADLVAEAAIAAYLTAAQEPAPEPVAVAWLAKFTVDGGTPRELFFKQNPKGLEDEVEVTPLYAAPVASPLVGLEAQKNYDALRTFAHEATKAITGLTGGGSEYFGKEVDGVFLADLPRCVERLRARLDRAALSAASIPAGVIDAARNLLASLDPDNDLKSPEQFNAWSALDLALTLAPVGGQTDLPVAGESLWVPAKPEHSRIGRTYDFDQTERLADAAEKATGYGATMEVVEFVMAEADRRHKSTLSQPHPAVEALERMVALYESEHDADVPFVRPDWLVAALSAKETGRG
jgi:hypothetical protein